MARKKKQIELPKYGKYILQCRYETWTRTGKEWTKWFVLEHSDDKDFLKEASKIRKETTVNKKMKLKEEYRIIESSEYVEDFRKRVG